MFFCVLCLGICVCVYACVLWHFSVLVCKCLFMCVFVFFMCVCACVCVCVIVCVWVTNWVRLCAN